MPHGGSIGASLFHELSDLFVDWPKKKFAEEKHKSKYALKREKFNKKLSSRFTGPLEFEQDFNLAHWQTGTVLGRKAWLDTRTGMIWGSDTYTGSADGGGEGLQPVI